MLSFGSILTLGHLNLSANRVLGGKFHNQMINFSSPPFCRISPFFSRHCHRFPIAPFPHQWSSRRKELVFRNVIINLIYGQRGSSLNTIHVLSDLVVNLFHPVIPLSFNAGSFSTPANPPGCLSWSPADGATGDTKDD